MKYACLAAFSCFMPTLSPAVAAQQCWWQQPPIGVSADGAPSVFAIDLDGDGDADVLSASANDDKIAWYENLGGTFGDPVFNQRVVTISADGARSVFATDLDGDGDADVLSASFSDYKIAWYRTLPGIVGSCGDELGARYCSPVFPNSTGSPGLLLVFGSSVVANNDVRLSAIDLPLNAFGLFLTSRTQHYVYPVVNSQGALCVGGGDRSIRGARRGHEFGLSRSHLTSD